MPTSRIDACFTALKSQNRSALVSFVMAGDPDYQTSLEIIKALPESGADIIEIGMPFSDPMADGPAIQLAGQRALKGGQTLQKTITLVREFRKSDKKTPIILMGYYNLIEQMGNAVFLKKAKAAGVDGLIIVDLPPEADDELCLPALEAGLSFIRLTTPTTDSARLPAVLKNTSGFVYYVSVTGITGAAAPDPKKVAKSVRHIKSATNLPICVGFGVKTPEQAAAIGRVADGVVVGSAIVSAIAKSLDKNGNATVKTIGAVTGLVKRLAKGLV